MDLRPCPFCGSAPEIVRPLGAPYVTCRNQSCLVSIMTTCSATLEQQVEAWNRRASEPFDRDKALEAALCVMSQWDQGTINQAELRTGLEAAYGRTPEGPDVLAVASHCGVPSLD